MRPRRHGRSVASRPFARNAPITPVRTSPVPAVAREGGLCRRRSSARPARATIVSAPLSSTTAPCRSASSAAARRRCAETHSDSTPSRRASSPAWGVSTVGPVAPAARARTARRRRRPPGATNREQLVDERTRLLRATQARPEGEGGRAAEVGRQRVSAVAYSKPCLTGSRARVSTTGRSARDRERDVAGIGTESRGGGEHRGAGRSLGAADHQQAARSELRVGRSAQRHAASTAAVARTIAVAACSRPMSRPRHGRRGTCRARRPARPWRRGT